MYKNDNVTKQTDLSFGGYFILPDLEKKEDKETVKAERKPKKKPVKSNKKEKM